MGLSSTTVKSLARGCGFELAGVAAAGPLREAEHYQQWVASGMAGRMGYLTDHRAEKRNDPRNLLPSARAMVCVGRLYNTPVPYSIDLKGDTLAWISRYAWADDYHEVMRRGLEKLVRAMERAAGEPFEWKICVDTAPLLERAYARRAGLGWIGRNSCLINEPLGSWFFLGEVLVSLELEPDTPPPDRCGVCTACIDACPTGALMPVGRKDGPEYTLDSRRCISYFTIELKGPIPVEDRGGLGRHVFGCDICQDVCPWNRQAPVTSEAAFAPRFLAPPLEELAAIDEGKWAQMFAKSPILRTKYRGFARNVAVAMGNSGHLGFRDALMRLASHPDPVIADHARWALEQIEKGSCAGPIAPGNSRP